VIFQDDSKHVAKILGRDSKTDLALLKIDTSKPLPYVAYGETDTNLFCTAKGLDTSKLKI